MKAYDNQKLHVVLPAIKGRPHTYITLQNGKNNLSVKSVAKFEKITAREDDTMDLDSTVESKVGQEVFVMTFDFNKQLDLILGDYKVNLLVVD